MPNLKSKDAALEIVMADSCHVLHHPEQAQQHQGMISLKLCHAG